MTTILQNWIATPLALALGRALIHFLWEGAAIAALLAAILHVGGARSARFRYGLSAFALLALPLIFGVTLALCVPQASRTTIGHRAPVPFNAALPVAADAPPLRDPSSMLRFARWLAPVWIIGVLLCYMRILIGWFAALRLRRRGVCAAPESWQARLNELAAGLRLSRGVVLLESCLADVPVVIGWLRPVILVPLGLLAGLPADQMEAILIHELAHIRRHDYAVNLLQGFVEGLLFYHPAVWWISRVVRMERENCCDDVVVSHCSDARVDLRTYVAALATLEEHRALSGASGEVVLAATGGNLMKRISRLLSGKEPQRARGPVAPALGVGLLLIVAAGSVAGTMRSQSGPAPQSSPQAAPHSAPQGAPRAISAPVAVVAPAPVPYPAAGATPAPAPYPVPRPQSATPYKKWIDEDVVYIISAEERLAFADLQTDAERDHFIEQFWLRRDPTPDTPRNEYKEEHYRRIAYTNEHYSSSRPGWRSDRGRFYIVYGPADEIETHPNGDATRAYPFEQWQYRWIEGMGRNVIVEFADPNNTGEFKMTSAPARRYTGAPISIDVKNVDIRDFFHLIVEVSKLDVVVDPAVKVVLTMKLTDVPWDEAVDVVTRQYHLTSVRESNLLRVTVDPAR